MGHDVHTLHVRAPTATARARAIRALRDAMLRAGYRDVARDASVTIRTGGRGPWLSIVADTPSVLAPAAAAIARATSLPIFEAYCEASAVVSLELRAGGRHYTWPTRRPPARVLDPLLAHGDASTFAAAFERGLAAPFPETALTLAARELGITPQTMLGDTALRGEVLRFAKPVPRAKPARVRKLRVGWPSNRSWGERHLVFVGETSTLEVEATGPGDALAAEVTATPSLIEIRDIRPDPAQHAIHVRIRPRRAGACTLHIAAHTDRARGTDDLAVQVAPKPYRPRAAAGTDLYTLFQMHRRDYVYAFVTFRVDLGAAWAWSQPRALAWARLHADASPPTLTVDGTREPLGVVLPRARTLVIEAPTYRFGTFIPVHDPDEPLAVELVLRARGREDATPQLARLTATCDEAFRDGVAWSALAGEQGNRPDELTGWEHATLGDRDMARVARWHATHLRGLDTTFWMADEHATRTSLAALARYAAVERVGNGYRITMPPDAPRAAFAPIEDLLGDLLPDDRR